MKRTLLLSIFIITSYCALSAQSINIQPSEQLLIVGTWTSEQDSLWHLEFKTDGTCLQYEKDSLIETDHYQLSFDTPVCEQEAKITEKPLFLSLVDQKNDERLCYEVYGISDKRLGIRPVDLAWVMLFERRKKVN